MIVTVENLNIDFIDDIDELKRRIEEYKRLETAIEDSVFYKLLAGKTQTLGKNKGVSQKERSRLLHSKSVANIAGELVGKIYDSALEANDSFGIPGKWQEIFRLNRELAVLKAKCIGKAHDIGHEAFGHTGERSKNQFYSELTPEEIEIILQKHRDYFGEEYEKEQGHGSDIKEYARSGNTVSFEHNEQSAILFNEIVKNNKIRLPEDEIKDCTMGILAHSTSRISNPRFIEGNLPGQAVRVADKIEYRIVDFDELKTVLAPPKEPIVAGFFRLKFRDKIKLIIDGIADEAKCNGRIWELNTDRHGRKPIMQDLKEFREEYEKSIFHYDFSYSENILENQLFPIIDDDKKLKEFYDNNPGVEVWYPKWKLRRIEENESDLDTNIDYSVSPEDVDISVWNSRQIVPFRSILQGENPERLHHIYKKVLQYYYDNPDKIPEEGEIKIRPIDYTSDQTISYKLDPNYSNAEKALTYISLFDDTALMERYYELVEERIKKGIEYGIEPVTSIEMKNFTDLNYIAALNSFRIKSKLTGRSAAEVENKYKEEAEDFYSSGLTEKGKKIYNEFYKRRFLDYAIDKELYERMIEADKEVGLEYDYWKKYYGPDYEDAQEKQEKAEDEQISDLLMTQSGFVEVEKIEEFLRGANESVRNRIYDLLTELIQNTANSTPKKEKKQIKSKAKNLSHKAEEKE